MREGKQNGNETCFKYIDSTILALINNIGKNTSNHDETLLVLGDKLAEIKLKIISEYDDQKNVKFIFNAIKKEIAKKMRSTDITTINKLVKITTNMKITHYRKENKVPNRWGTLTLLTTLKDEQIERLVNSGEIDSHTTRAELKKLIGRERNVVEYERSMLMIINESMSTVKNQDIERINEMLKELGWKVKLKK